MAKIENVVCSKGGKNLDIAKLPDGLFVVFTCDSDSDFIKKQLPLFSSKSRYFEENDCSVFFVVGDKDPKKEGVLFDQNGEIVDLVEDLKNKDDVGENLLIFSKKGEEIEFSELKETPENEYDWTENVEYLVKNFHNNEPDDSNLWRWGQLVPQDGDYLCVDCGYIEEMKKGQTFPICVVCLSGEVDGPSGPGEGYWELV